MRKRDTRKLRQNKTIRSYTRLRKTVEDTVKDGVSSMRPVSRLDNIRIELIKPIRRETQSYTLLKDT